MGSCRLDWQCGVGGAGPRQADADEEWRSGEYHQGGRRDPSRPKSLRHAWIYHATGLVHTGAQRFDAPCGVRNACRGRSAVPPGTVSFPGLDPKSVEILNKEWKLKPGDVFDASYPGTFFADVIRPRLRPSTTPPETKLDVDEKNRLVNVGFVFGR